MIRVALASAVVCGLTATLLVHAQDRVTIGRVTVRIGEVEGAAEYLFGEVGGLRWDKGGRILVADRKAHVVKVYSPAGKFQFQFGHQGAGPSDLNMPCCLTFDNAGNLWVLSANGRRYDKFELSELKATHQERIATPGSPSRNPLMFSGRDRIAAIGLIANGAVAHELVRLSSTGQEKGRVRVPRPTIPEEKRHLPATLPDASGDIDTVFVPVPYGDRQLIEYAADGMIAYAVNSEYRATLLDANGRVFAEIRGQPRPIEITPQERDSIQKVQASYHQIWRARGGTYPTFSIPRFKPPIKQMWFDLDGQLWVQRAEERTARVSVADVYARDGRLLRRAEWPRDVDLGLGAVDNRQALGIVVDELGVQSVVKLIWN